MISPLATDALERLEPLASGVIATRALAVDTTGAFPTHTVTALREAGLLGLVTPVEHGGLGGTVGDAALVVERIARSCGSSAMITCMHYCGAAVLAAHGSAEVNQAIARGEHLSTLAFSEQGSRSHFWTPMSTARAAGPDIVLDARKSWITSASHATAYVWSSKPVTAEGASTLWLVEADAVGLSVQGRYLGMGLRGNDSTSVHADSVTIAPDNRLGPDGGGFDIMMGVVVPAFQLMNAACSVGLMEAALDGATRHVRGTRFGHTDQALRDLPTIRAYLAKARIQADAVRALWLQTIDAVVEERPEAPLAALKVKAAAGDASLEVLGALMRVCGGAAYRKEVGVERNFRDAQASCIMSPTSDLLYDFVGRAMTGMDLF